MEGTSETDLILEKEYLFVDEVCELKENKKNEDQKILKKWWKYQESYESKPIQEDKTEKEEK